MQRLIKLILTDKVMMAIALIITIFILYLSLMPTKDLPKIKFKEADKAYHFIAYFFLSLCWFIYFCIIKNKWKSPFLVILTISIILFGIIVEVMQKNFTDYRTFDWWDIVFNSTAVVFVLIIFKTNKTRLDNFRHQLNV